MGGVNPTIQLAAALDRRGISVTVDLDRIRVHIHRREHMVIRPRTEGVTYLLKFIRPVVYAALGSKLLVMTVVADAEVRRASDDGIYGRSG